MLNCLQQGWGTLILEGRCPAEFSSNPNQTHLKQLIKVFRMQLGIFLPWFFRFGAKLCRRVALQDQRSPPLAYSMIKYFYIFFHIQLSVCIMIIPLIRKEMLSRCLLDLENECQLFTISFFFSSKFIFFHFMFFTDSVL